MNAAKKIVEPPRLAQILLATPRFKGASPTTRTPMTVGSVRPDVPLNDDEAEKRQRRKENHLRSVMSPGCHTPRSAAHYSERPGDSGTSSFSNTEIADHYAVCIQLSAENKISSKNAFGLHLIDWMREVLNKRGELSNFKVAGCTIDASAKIYAGRIDSIYNDAFKMLGGFGRQETENGGNDSSDSPPQRQGVRKKGKKNSTIEKDTNNLNVNTFDLEFEVDPLFKKISSTIDEEGVDGLLLNQIPIDSDGCDLMLDASRVPVMEDLQITTTAGENTNISLTDIKALLESVKEHKICPSFANFRFNQNGECDDWSAMNTSSSNNEYCPKPNTDYTMVQQPSQALTDSEPISSNPSINGDYGNDDFQGDYDQQDPLSSDTILGTCGNKQVLQRIDQNMESCGGSSSQNVMSGDLYLMNNIEISEYSYFKPQVLSAWAGADHWKLRPGKRENDIMKTNISKKRQPNQPFRINFTKAASQELFKKGKASTVMSKAAIDKLCPSLTTLPHDPHTDISLLYQLFTRPQLKVRRKKISAAIEEQFEGETYQYDNPTDNATYVDDDGGGCAGGDSHFDLDDVRLGAKEFMSLLANEVGDNLIAEPKKVNPIQIDYAKHAKRIDVKKVKSSIWDILSRESMPVVSSESSSPVSFSSVPFTSVYSDIVKTSSSSNNDMSVSMSLVCLLHLANEKILSITDRQDMSDLMISLTSESPPSIE